MVMCYTNVITFQFGRKQPKKEYQKKEHNIKTTDQVTFNLITTQKVPHLFKVSSNEKK